jgi:hypothetical protein
MNINHTPEQAPPQEQTPVKPGNRTTQTTHAVRSYRLTHPQAVAWAVVNVSFMMFCVFCLAATFAARWFVLDSQMPMAVTLYVSKGRVEVRQPDGTTTIVGTSLQVESGSLIVADSAAQGYLSFEDNYSRRVVAILHVLQDSSIRLGDGSRPRFEWSSNPYKITFDQALGRFQVRLMAEFTRQLSFNLHTAHGTISTESDGEFRIETNDTHTTLYTVDGKAALYQGVPNESSEVTAGAYASLSTVDPVTNVQAINSRVLNANFGNAEDIKSNPALPIGWACTSSANRQNEPQGSSGRLMYDARISVQMTRQGDGLDHAETRCIYTFSQLPGVPLDVTGYKTLSIRAKIKILGQDVTTCGVQGSECPVMLELEYLGPNNVPEEAQFWRHGFYAIRPPNDQNPLSCDTCLQEHEKLVPDVWYLYDSGDLFKLLPENKRPEKLIRLKVYASGHAYDAIITELQVVAGR